MSDCTFCLVVLGELKSWKVYEDECAYAFFDVNPVSEYHTLVIPKHHYADVFAMPERETLLVMRAVKRVVDLYETKLGIRNLHIISNSGPDAQQDVFHAHFHIIPRAAGDGQDRFRTTHPELRGHFDELLKRLSPA